MRRRYPAVFAFLFLGVSIFAAGDTVAQSPWIEPHGRNELNLEIVKPPFKEADFSTFTRTLFLSTRLKTGRNSNLVIEVPFAYVGEEDGDESEKAFGNIYIGAEMGSPTSGFQFEFGARAPTAPKDNSALIVGAYTDYVDRFESFFPEIMSFVVGGRYRYRTPSGFALHTRLAPVVWVDMGDGLQDGAEMWVLFSVQAMMVTERASFGGGFSTRTLLSEDELDPGEQMTEQLGVFCNLYLGRWRPSLQIKIPMDDRIKEVLETQFCFSIGLALP